MQPLPTLRQLQYLIALADQGSFQKAAADCHVTQSTLSGGLKDMEDILQAPVIDRTSRRSVRFTPLGDEVVREARQLIARMENLAYRARAQNEPLSWPLRLGVIPTIAPYLLPACLKPLQDALPALELHLHEAQTAVLLEKVNDGSLDFGLIAFPYDIDGLQTRILYEEEFWCAAPPGHFTDRKTLTLEDLHDERLLLLEDGHCVRDHALEACKLRPIRETKSLSAASLSTLIQMVHQGYGITLLPEMVVQSNLLPEGLTLRRFSKGAPTRQIGFVWKHENMRGTDIALVTNVFADLVRSQSEKKTLKSRG